MSEKQKSRIYIERPAYADFPAPQKFEAIKSIIAKHLTLHPNACCSYSGGSDSDILIDLIEEVRKTFNLPPIAYEFFNTGLEMDATKRHVREIAEKYGVEICEIRPKINIVLATKKNGIPFVSKAISEGLSRVQRKKIPLEIADEFSAAENKKQKREELRNRFPKSEAAINFLCSCNKNGKIYERSQLFINSSKYMLDFIKENPVPFKISDKCCEVCKKRPAHEFQKRFEMIITGERFSEGGKRAVDRNAASGKCFSETADGKFRLRPLFYVSDADKAWYKEWRGLRYSDAYEVYGLRRTGCCGCPISSRAVEDLEKIRPFEPNLVKAAWNVFGESYRYRKKYNEYKEARKKEEKERKKIKQYTIDEIEDFLNGAAERGLALAKEQVERVT